MVCQTYDTPFRVPLMVLSRFGRIHIHPVFPGNVGRLSMVPRAIQPT
jgi:hypothetical protein